MNKINSIFFLIPFLMAQTGYPCVITNGIEEWRRLGDGIITVIKAKYYAQKFKIPFYYSNFPYCQDFLFSDQEKALTDNHKASFSRIMIINEEKDIQDALDGNESILFVTHFLCPTPDLFDFIKDPQNADFCATIEKMFQLKTPIEPLPKKPSTLHVALHVRKGGGYDFPLDSQQEYTLDAPLLKSKQIYIHRKNPGIATDDIWPLTGLAGPGFTTQTKLLLFKKNNYSDYIWPIKLPPDQYYIEQIKVLVSMLPPEKQLQIILFTDDPNPEGIVERYLQALGNPSKIEFYFRKFDNKHNQNVVEDLFYLASCDCIISAYSSFALSAHLIGHHSIIICPEHAITLPDKVIIDKIKTITIENAHDAAMRKIVKKVMALKI